MNYKPYREAFIIWPCLLAIGLILVSCSPETGTPSESAAEIRIGIIHSTGPKAVEEASRNVLEMIRDRLVENGGLVVGGESYPATFVIRDIDGQIPEQAVQAAQELINQEKVMAILGLLSSIDSIPLGEVAEQSGIPFIAASSTHPRTTAGRRFVFRVALLDDFQAQMLARFSMLDLRAENIAVLYNAANIYSRGLAEEFRKTVVQGGGQICVFDSYVTGATDFTAQLERIRENSPDVLFLPNYFDETEPIVIKARSMGIDAVLLGTDCWEVRRAADIPQFEGAYMFEHLSMELSTGRIAGFSEEYRSRYGQTPDSGALLVYDAYGIVLAAIQHVGSFKPDAVRDAIYDMEPFEGESGKIDFVDCGDPVMEGVIVRFKDGQIRFVKKITPESE